MNGPYAKLKQALKKTSTTMSIAGHQATQASEAVNDFGFAAAVALQTDEALRAKEVTCSLIARTNKKAA